MIQRLQTGPTVTGMAGPAGPAGHGGGGFGDLLNAAVSGVDASQTAADAQLEGLATGRNVDLHGSMIALEEANISLRAMTSVRDKLVDAYQSIWNMPI